jgi:cytidine deaminase
VAAPPADLLARARAARANAHAPYSRFQVGAAVRAADGSIHAGCNVESSSYGLTICAERAAVFAAVAAGATGAGRAPLREACLVAAGPRPVPPCGACRQVLFEHLAPDATIWMVEAGSGAAEPRTPAELLPDGFDPSFLGASGAGGGQKP